MAGPPPLREALQLLREPNFARLFAARLTAAFGNAMAPIAVAFAVLEITGSKTAVGLVLGTQTAAQVAMQLFGGAAADRFSRKRVILVANVVAASGQAVAATLLLVGVARAPHLAVTEAVLGLSFAMIWPASMGLVPLVVRPQNLQPANALLSIAQAGSFGVGGAIGGVLVAWLGPGVAIGVDACAFLLSALLISGLRPAAQTREDSTSLLRDLRDGWQEFISHRWLWAIVAQFSLVVAAWFGGFMVLGPVVAEASLGGAATWGIIAAAHGFGLLAGGLAGLRLVAPYPMRTASICVFGLVPPLVLLSFPAHVGWIAAGAFAAGVGIEVFSVLWNTALHTHVAPEALSRVSAYDILGSIGLAPLGMAAAGPLAEAFGNAATLQAGAAVVALATGAVLLVPEVRQLRG